MQTVLRTLAMVALVGCISGPVKVAVQAYGAATDGAAQAGIALVTECQAATQDPAAESKRTESCEKAKKLFTTIQQSATQLQGIK